MILKIFERTGHMFQDSDSSIEFDPSSFSYYLDKLTIKFTQIILFENDE